MSFEAHFPLCLVVVQLYQALLQRPMRGFGAITHAQSAQYAMNVAFDGPACNVKFLRDLPVRATLRNQPQDFDLLWRQAAVLRGRHPHASCRRGWRSFVRH